METSKGHWETQVHFGQCSRLLLTLDLQRDTNFLCVPSNALALQLKDHRH